MSYVVSLLFSILHGIYQTSAGNSYFSVLLLWLYVILVVQILCSNVRFLLRKYYACQILSFIYYAYKA